MNGDLTIAAPAAVDPVPSAPRGFAGRSRPAVRDPAVPSVAEAVRTAESRQPPLERLSQAVRLKGLLTDPAMRVSTHHDEASGRVVLEVRKRATGEVVEQIPSDELLRLYAALRESLVDEQV